MGGDSRIVLRSPHLAEVLAGLRLELVERAIGTSRLPARDLELARGARFARVGAGVVALGGVAAGFARGAARGRRVVVRRPAGRAGGEGEDGGDELSAPPRAPR